MSNYDYKDQSDHLESERRQNSRLKSMAKNPSWRSNDKEGIQTLKPEIVFMSFRRSNAKTKFLLDVQTLIWAIKHQSL